MTIRLTSPEVFDRVLEKLKQEYADLWDDDPCNTSLKYCAQTIKEGISKGDDEWYLDVEILPNLHNSKSLSVALRYYKRSEIPTDKEYLNEE